MPRITFPLSPIVTCLEDGQCLGCLLLFPEASAYGADAAEVQTELSRIAKKLLPDLPLHVLHRRRMVNEVQVRVVTVQVPPPASRVWSDPLPMRFHAVCWEHGNQATIAYLPSLDIEVVARRQEDLEPLIVDHVRFALMRRKANGSLRELILLQRAESISTHVVSQQAEIPTAKQRAERREAAPEKSVLEQVASQWTGAKLPPVFEMDDVVEQLADWVRADSPRSVLLVGPSGVGKTAAVYKLAADAGRRRSGRQPVWSTSGARIVAGMCGLGMWQERCQTLIREAAATAAIVHLGNLMELLQVGQSEGNDLGVGEFLRPAIARGELVTIAECTPEELTIIERLSPGMVDAFTRLQVGEPSRDASRRILSQAMQVYGQGGNPRLDDAALATLDRLHRRYATYSAYPGRPLRFLRHLLEDAPQGRTLSQADVTAAFSHETGLPLKLLEETVPLDLAATRTWFRDRVVGQDEAVEIVVDLLATAKADLARPDRPLASLMFIGPTGVGKTEMAKTLAEFLYQDRRRLTRIDMSEYADPQAIDRLIGGAGRREGLLTSKVREQPFGVVLLDEFEKAHPRFFDLLLQVLGEGRLTDGAGRVADFRNSVIIMTSNLGAESFGRRAPGFAVEEFADHTVEDHFTSRVKDFLRPEMFNRIDRIVTFLPLSKSVLQDIAGRELELLRQRDGIRYRSLEVEFEPDLAAWLVDQCYDPRYGARPIKRAIERHILTPAAVALNEDRSHRPLHLQIAPGQHRPRVLTSHASFPQRSCEAKPYEIPAGNSEAVAVGKCMDLRRKVLRLQRSHAVQELQNDLYRLRKAKQRRESQDQRRTARNRQPSHADSHEQDAWLAVLEPLAERLEQLVAEAIALEDQVSGAWYLSQSIDADAIIPDTERLSKRLQQLSLELYARQSGQPDYATLVVYGEDLEWKQRLALAFADLTASRGYRAEVYEILTYSERPPSSSRRILLGDRESKIEKKRVQANETRLLAKQVKSAEAALSRPAAQAVGLAFCIRGPFAWLLLQPEEGLHVWQEGSRKIRCLVHVSQSAMPAYQPPFRIDRREGIGKQEVRRLWNRDRGSIDDRRLRSKPSWPGGAIGPTLAELLEQHLQDRVEEWIRS